MTAPEPMDPMQILALRAQMGLHERSFFDGFVKGTGAAYDTLTAPGSEALSPAALDALAYDAAMVALRPDLLSVINTTMVQIILAQALARGAVENARTIIDQLQNGFPPEQVPQ